MGGDGQATGPALFCGKKAFSGQLSAFSKSSGAVLSLGRHSVQFFEGPVGLHLQALRGMVFLKLDKMRDFIQFLKYSLGLF
jgi:hypothetical protein